MHMKAPPRRVLGGAERIYVLLSYIYDTKSLYAGCLIVGGWTTIISIVRKLRRGNV